MKDWTGNEQFIRSGNNRKSDAEDNDYYATEPKAVKLLLEKEKFNHCSCFYCVNSTYSDYTCCYKWQ